MARSRLLLVTGALLTTFAFSTACRSEWTFLHESSSKVSYPDSSGIR